MTPNAEHYSDPTADKAVRNADRDKKTLKIRLDPEAIAPTREKKTDAGFDLYAPNDLVIYPRNRGIINTGVHVQLPDKTVGHIMSKLRLMAKYGLITEGAIDEGYDGAIKVVIFNTTDKALTVKKGMKICQLVVEPVVYPPIEVEL